MADPAFDRHRPMCLLPERTPRPGSQARRAATNGAGADQGTSEVVRACGPKVTRAFRWAGSHPRRTR
jgi:hypothetical protein